MARLALVSLLAIPLAGCSDDEYVDAACEPSDPATTPEDVAACGSATLLAKPADLAERGAWPVGVRSVSVDGLTTEVWYPGKPGTEPCGAQKVYDLRDWLPASERGKIPDAENPWQPSSGHEGIPLDERHGPYPVVLFVHGTAGFRTQSLAHMEHWASRGFVVVSADHPGLFLGDALDLKLVRDLPGDIAKLLGALAQASGELEFLSGHLDLDRMGMVGHSAGGAAIQNQGKTSGVRVLIPLAAGGTEPGASLESTLVVGGLDDKVVAWDKTLEGYAASPTKKRLIGLSKAGHLFPTELCWLANDAGQNIVEVATEHSVKNVSLASFLFDCPQDQLSRQDALDIVNYATAAALEETLHCTPGDAFSGMPARFAAIADYRQEL